MLSDKIKYAQKVRCKETVHYSISEIQFLIINSNTFKKMLFYNFTTKKHFLILGHTFLYLGTLSNTWAHFLILGHTFLSFDLVFISVEVFSNSDVDIKRGKNL